jgi:hypothetical protein
VNIPKRVKYKGYVINASPYQLKETLKWIINLYIEKHSEAGVKMRQFNSSNTYDTLEESTKQCHIFGQQIIDGNINGCTVDDL